MVRDGDMSRVVVTGATGLIGGEVCRELGEDYEVVGLSRDAARARDLLGDVARVVEWDGVNVGDWCRELEGAKAVVHLAGESVAGGFWTRGKKERILRSRVDGARVLAEAVEGLSDKPAAVLVGSAIGYYGSRGAEVLEEGSSAGSGFLAEVCQKVESFYERFRDGGVRCVFLRTGLVLSGEGGLLGAMLKLRRLGFKSYFGESERWLSWIHIKDEAGLIKFLIERYECEGAFNLVSPGAVTAGEMEEALAEVTGKRRFLKVPGFAVRLGAAEMADELLLSSQRAVPAKAEQCGYEFKFRDLVEALREILI